MIEIMNWYRTLLYRKGEKPKILYSGTHFQSAYDFSKEPNISFYRRGIGFEKLTIEKALVVWEEIRVFD